MTIQGVRRTAAKGLTAAALAVAVMILTPAKAHAQLTIAAQFGNGYGYDDGRNDGWQRDHYEHERDEAIARHEAWERRQAWEQQQAYSRQQEFYRQQMWAHQREHERHEAWEHGYRRHDDDHDRGYDGDRWR